MKIETTANRVKKAGNWCEDADKLTQAALDKYGHNWDTPLDIHWGLENLGVANTVLALNFDAVLPRYRMAAAKAEYLYFCYIVDLTTEALIRLSPELEPMHKFDRDLLKRMESRPNGVREARRRWTGENTPIAQVMLILLCDGVKKNIKCLHAGKALLDIWRGIDPNRDVLSEMKGFLWELTK